MKIPNMLTFNPKGLFLIDGLGALLTAFLVGIVLRMFEDAFGMPSKFLDFLSVLGGVFAIYSISCYLFVPKNWRIFLRVIAIANLLYCLLTAVLVILLYQQLTILGVIYFIGEILIVIALVYVEWSVSSENIIE